MTIEFDTEPRIEASPRLTLVKAYRIVHNLDTNKICEQAQISRSYLTRVEQGATPSAVIAARLVKVLTNTDSMRAAHPPATTAKAELLEAARRLVEYNKAAHPEFANGCIQEIHLLYPERYQAGSPYGDAHGRS